MGMFAIEISREKEVIVRYKVHMVMLWTTNELTLKTLDIQSASAESE